MRTVRTRLALSDRILVRSFSDAPQAPPYYGPDRASALVVVTPADPPMFCHIGSIGRMGETQLLMELGR